MSELLEFGAAIARFLDIYGWPAVIVILLLVSVGLSHGIHEYFE